MRLGKMYKDSRNVAARHTRAFSYEVVLFRPALGQNIVDRTAESYTALRDHLLLFPTVFFIFFYLHHVGHFEIIVLSCAVDGNTGLFNSLGHYRSQIRAKQINPASIYNTVI